MSKSSRLTYLEDRASRSREAYQRARKGHRPSKLAFAAAYRATNAALRPAMKGEVTVGWARLPVFFTGSDRDRVIANARDFWAEEQSKLARREANKAAMSARQRKAS